LFFLGSALEDLGQLDEALAQYAKVRERFPLDRQVHQRTGRILWRQGKLDLSLAAFLRVLAIDPEDREAHYHRMLLYRALADEAATPEAKSDALHAAAEAEKAFRKFSLDESAQKWTNEFRRERPDVNLESQPVHVHRLEPRP
jgi:tetratricopeptide (TPR) repeat protein